MSAALRARLAGETVRMAVLWRLLRRDGVAVGLTSHDRDLVVGGLPHRAAPGVLPSAVVLGSTPDEDMLDVDGAFDTRLLAAEDLDAGRWDGALVELAVADWSAPELGRLVLMRGRIGAAVRGQGRQAAYRLEIEAEMPTPPVRAVRCSPLCRATLGDGHCGVDMAGRTVRVSVVGIEGGRVQVAPAPADPTRFALGRARVLSGRWAGIDRQILAMGPGGLVIDRAGLPDDALTGADLGLTEGCDGRLETCATRFGNVRWFDGEPFVPGQDALWRHGEP